MSNYIREMSVESGGIMEYEYVYESKRTRGRYGRYEYGSIGELREMMVERIGRGIYRGELDKVLKGLIYK